MTESDFVKNTDGKYVAEFTMDGATALHIERAEIGSIVISQRSGSAGNYANIDGFNEKYQYQPIIDVDLKAEVYPKYIKVVSDTPVTKAYTAS